MRKGVRDKLCKGCLKVIRYSEKEYQKENKKRIKEQRHEFYLKQIKGGKIKRGSKKIYSTATNREDLKWLKERIKDETIY